MRVAAIDVGTNSVRLLVAQAGPEPSAGPDGSAGPDTTAGPALVTIERLMEITRLGQGVDRTGRLDPAAIERTVEVLGRFRAVMDAHGVGRGADDRHLGRP